MLALRNLSLIQELNARIVVVILAKVHCLKRDLIEKVLTLKNFKA